RDESLSWPWIGKLDLFNSDVPLAMISYAVFCLKKKNSAPATTPFTWLENAFLAEVEIAHRAWATAAHNRWLTTLHHLLSPSAATRANHRPSESSRKGRTLLRAKSQCPISINAGEHLIRLGCKARVRAVPPGFKLKPLV